MDFKILADKLDRPQEHAMITQIRINNDDDFIINNQQGFCLQLKLRDMKICQCRKGNNGAINFPSAIAIYFTK